MHPPGAAVIRHRGHRLDNPPEKPLDGPIDPFTPKIESLDHVQKAVSQHTHLQRDIVGLGETPLKSMAPCQQWRYGSAGCGGGRGPVSAGLRFPVKGRLFPERIY